MNEFIKKSLNSLDSQLSIIEASINRLIGGNPITRMRSKEFTDYKVMNGEQKSVLFEYYFIRCRTLCISHRAICVYGILKTIYL
ncbi:hypothetical protein DFP93_101393 [Aneurinibacillus soli]|uniref:Uncharacterized protein n=1 Tax=Aneurinibacillus soli TaxID=1500254 RepID=A0A0U5AX61_9BACL|nr:hypothetical protein [Aneurinibacillus soli]PYE64365.1 hypothetical protein DFP93_101393 [Aneurinibacillus soli]BAU28314.1 hypothetical protein CB4_02488 [Aneurinibacillus soli]